MSQLIEILPKHKPNLIDLVKAAGVDVRKWSNGKGGKARASTNPKFCYNWAFIEPNKVVVLNLWYEHMKERNEVISIHLNNRGFALELRGRQKSRSGDVDEAIKMAMNQNLPIRVIVQSGDLRDIRNPEERPSEVSKRLLDPVPWAVTSYDTDTGDCTLTRNVGKESAVNDLDDVPDGNDLPDRANVVTKVIKRDARVRAYALRRANGRCEYCNVQGFLTANGGYYLEAHHIIALGDSGRDTIENVIALCPLHHRQAHYGIGAETLEAEFANILKRLNAS
jgi:5-methylcytosine-specific restriction protein A